MIRKILDTIVFADYAVQDLLIVAIVAVVFLIVFRILMKAFRKEEVGRHSQVVDCFNCGWHGKVSRHAGRCPQCNEPLGDQKVQRRP